MNIEGFKIRPSKHFALTWMRKWAYDIDDLRKIIQDPVSADKVGKNKYEIYFRDKKSGKKLIIVKDDEYKEIFVITGAEGK